MPPDLRVAFELDDPDSDLTIAQAIAQTLNRHGMAANFTRADIGWTASLIFTDCGDLASQTVFGSKATLQSEAEAEIYQLILGEFAANLFALTNAQSNARH